MLLFEPCVPQLNLFLAYNHCFVISPTGNGLHILSYHLSMLIFALCRTGFPQGLENRENREKNNGQGKVREFYFGPKVREFCFKLPIAMKICCYSCRLSRMFVTVFTNMKVHMWILKRIFVFFIVFKCYIKLFQTTRFVWYIYIRYSSTISCR